MNQPAVNGGFAPQTLFLGLAASSLASSFLRVEELSARSFLLWGLPAALGLCLLSALLAAEFQARELFSGKGVFSRLGCGVSGLWFAVELIRTVRTAQEVCWSQFSSMAALSVLPLLLWAGWAVPPASWNASARVLWWFVAVGGVVCLLGLAGQLHWYRLFTPAQPAAANWDVPVYAEYFAGALLCSARSARRTVWLPVWGFAVQAAALLGCALLFGSGTYPRLELLRAWSSGSFSRMDALLLLIWLTCAIFRTGFLCAAVRTVWQRAVQCGKGAVK